MNTLPEQMNRWCESAGIRATGRQAELRRRLSDEGVKRTRGAVSRWFSETIGTRPDDDAIRALVRVLDLGPTDELALYRLPVLRSEASAA